jgi:broad specificity phosphatase PhoE
MIRIFFFRHGQAGPREHYDELSELGREQARRLGEWIQAEKLRFDIVRSGELRRQRMTAEIAVGPASVVPDLRWNEFDLDGVYAAIAPRLAAADPDFRQRYDELALLLASGDRAVHRRWTDTDTKVVRAWVEGRFPDAEVESWSAFVSRVLAAGGELLQAPAGAQIAVFTSATPIAIWVAQALALQPVKIMELAGASLNTAVTVLHARDGRVWLTSFNGVPHLMESGLRTNR